MHWALGDTADKPVAARSVTAPAHRGHERIADSGVGVERCVALGEPRRLAGERVGAGCAPSATPSAPQCTTTPRPRLLVRIGVLPVPLVEVIATKLERSGDGWPPPNDAVNAVCAVSSFAFGSAATELCYRHTESDSDHPATAERQRFQRIVRALPDDTPDRIIDTAFAVCGCDACDMFTNGLDLIVKGLRRRRRPLKKHAPPDRRGISTLRCGR